MESNLVTPLDDDEGVTYCIVRFYAPHTGRCREVIERGLTLDEAQEHCRRDDTRDGVTFFDGYEKEGR